MSLTIRDATVTDLPGLRALFLRTRREAFGWMPSESFQLDDFDTATLDERLMVAEDGVGELAGFISVWEPTDFIHHLFVSGQHQRLGIGRALLQALPDWSRKRYQLKCLTRNQQALAFYRTCGFFETASGQCEDGEYLLLESGITPRERPDDQ